MAASLICGQRILVRGLVIEAGFSASPILRAGGNPFLRDFPSGIPPNLFDVVRALLICSDDGCTALYEAHGRLEEIETLACECGCGLAIVGWPEPLPVNGRVPALELTLVAA
jgi:hypothetical protein